MITTERMSEQFEKLHLKIGKFPITLHHFTGPDLGDPHSHPYDFTTTILAGSYVEEIWSMFAGEWEMTTREHIAGTSRLVHAGDIHRIIRLPEGECVTSVVWHPKGLARSETRFYRLIDGVMRSRQWDEPDFPLTT